MRKFLLNFFVVLGILLLIPQLYAQERNITGQIISEVDRMPLPGANVVIKGSTKGVSTDLEGHFSLKANMGDRLEVSYIGFNNAEVVITTQTNYQIVLKSADNLMDEVVVVGYGVQLKKEVTGAISQVKGSTISNLISPSFESQLAGRAAGVQITNATGILGEAPKINIRGVASINSGTSPLIVLDGVPLSNSDMEANVATNALADINTNDIESFEVLKDGAATAIYGSRAANGVILITTKRGKKNSFQLNFSTVTGLAAPTKRYDLLETPDFITISNEKARNVEEDPWAAGTDFNTNWQDLVFRRSALQTDHNLNISGGTETGRYFLSLGYGQQEGVSIANDMTKYNIRANVDQDVNKWLTVGGSLAMSRNDLNAMNKNSNGLSGHIFNTVKQLPNVPVYDAKNPSGYNLDPTGTIGKWDNNESVGGQIPNILYTLNNNFYKSKADRSIVNIYADVNLAKGLKYRLQMGYDKTQKDERTFWNPVHGDGMGYNGLFQQYALEDQLWNVQNILSYNRSFNDKHNLGLTGVMEVQKNDFRYFYATGRDMADEYFNQTVITDAFGTQEIGGSASENSIKSFVGRATYNFDSRYFVQFSIRRDGLSNLAKAKRWQNFGGASLGWNIANEGFWSEIRDVVSEFKLRASYADVGNTQIGNYAYKGLYGLSKYGDLNGFSYGQFGNEDLAWETSKKTDFGLDLSFLNNRIRFTADYYKNVTEDMVLEKSVPNSLGIPDNLIKVNAGNMENKGLEFSLDGTLVNNENFSWDVGANVTFSKNRITSLPNGEDVFITYSTNSAINGNIIVREGESSNSLYGFNYWGVNKANGNPVYHKADGTLVQDDFETGEYYVFNPNTPGVLGEVSNLSATEDRVILGNTLPTYYGGFYSNMKIKNFDFSWMIRFSGGNKIFNYGRREMMTQNFNNNITEIMGRWQSPENPGDGLTPKLYGGYDAYVNSGVLTSRFVENGDFISLDNIQVGYNFAGEFLTKLRLKSFRLYAVAQNVAMITKYKGVDPEAISYYGVDAYGTPKNRVISLGINLSL